MYQMLDYGCTLISFMFLRWFDRYVQGTKFYKRKEFVIEGIKQIVGWILKAKGKEKYKINGKMLENIVSCKHIKEMIFTRIKNKCIKSGW